MTEFARASVPGSPASPRPRSSKARRAARPATSCAATTSATSPAGASSPTGWSSPATSRSQCWQAGENLAWGSGEDGTVRSIFRAWMRSPGHRQNILGEFDQIGVSLQVGKLDGLPRTPTSGRSTSARTWRRPPRPDRAPRRQRSTRRSGTRCKPLEALGDPVGAGAEARPAAPLSGAAVFTRGAAPARPARRRGGPARRQSSAAAPTVITAASEARAVASASSILSTSSPISGGRESSRSAPAPPPVLRRQRSVMPLHLRAGSVESLRTPRLAVELDFRRRHRRTDPRSSLRNPRDFFQPLAIGAPEPLREIPVKPVADDPLPRLLEREDGRQGGRHRRPRPTSCSATSRTRSRSTARRPPGRA